MPRTKPFDKKTSKTYALVNRPQHDPLIHDTDAPSQVFAELHPSSKQDGRNKIKTRLDLEHELGFSGPIRANEGEAAEHGIYFDDSAYDYMQHMRDLGGSTDAAWIDATAMNSSSSKGKSKLRLEDALRQATLEDQDSQPDLLSNVPDSNSLVEERQVRLTTWRQKYQEQQQVPDALAGFQPDMDPRLREVLEALEDDAYVDDDDDIFAQLAGDDHEEMSQEEWEDNLMEDGDMDDEDGWESDDTTKPMNEYRTEPAIQPSSNAVSTDNQELANQFTPADSADDGSWLAAFAKSKGADHFVTPPAQNSAEIVPSIQKFPKPSDLASSAALSSASQFSRRKKRKGALTSSTGFSMSSSALARTEPLSTLDSRFDKIAESYLEDDEDDDVDDSASVVTGMTDRTDRSKYSAFGSSQASEAPSLVSARLDAALDDFLGGANGNRRGRTMKKAGKQGQWGMQTGMEQLDEIRKGLGPARVKTAQAHSSKV